MVCGKCEKKLGKVVTPDPWKSGARNTTEGGGRKVRKEKFNHKSFKILHILIFDIIL